MEIKEIQQHNTEVITDVLCDSCGKSCKADEFIMENPLRVDNGRKMYIFEYMELKANWGFFSNKDLTNYTAAICEQCVDEKFKFIRFKKTSYRQSH